MTKRAQGPMVMMPRRSCEGGVSEDLGDCGGGGLTKKRTIHVSMTVRLAGRMENHDIEGGVDT